MLEDKCSISTRYKATQAPRTPLIKPLSKPFYTRKQSALQTSHGFSFRVLINRTLLVPLYRHADLTNHWKTDEQANNVVVICSQRTDYKVKVKGHREISIIILYRRNQLFTNITDSTKCCSLQLLVCLSCQITGPALLTKQ